MESHQKENMSYFVLLNLISYHPQIEQSTLTPCLIKPLSQRALKRIRYYWFQPHTNHDFFGSRWSRLFDQNKILRNNRINKNETSFQGLCNRNLLLRFVTDAAVTSFLCSSQIMMLTRAEKTSLSRLHWELLVLLAWFKISMLLRSKWRGSSLSPILVVA